MIYYRLLRDNKESGPYSEEEMIAKGFKPYDLLWADGKSPGWQYPSEISAFKEYAPIVEEQPFDRFYKKQPAQKPVVTVAATAQPSYSAQPEKIKDTRQQQPVAAPAYNFNVKDLPARHVHVTLPSGNTVNLTTLVAKKENGEPRSSVTVTNVPSQSDYSPAHAEPLTGPKKTADEQSARPVVTAKKIAVLNERVKAPAFHLPRTGFSWMLVLSAVIGVATLVGLGIMIGISITREKNDFVFNETLRAKTSRLPVTVTAGPVAPAVVPVTLSVADEPVPGHAAAPAKSKLLAQNAVVKNTQVSGNLVPEEKKLEAGNALTVKTRPVQNLDETVQPVKSLSVAIPANIEKSISISENDFSTGAFGGISGLKFTLFNGSKLPLQAVEVEIDYIQANNKIYKTEKLLFKDILAGAQATVDAPASTRGVKVTSRIIKITPKDAALSNTTAKS